MRKTTKMKLSAILGAAAILVAGGAFAMTNNTMAKAEDVTPTLKFKGANVVFDDGVHLMYAVDEENVAAEDVQILIWDEVPANAEYVYGTQNAVLDLGRISTEEDVNLGAGYAVYYYEELAAKQMTDVIYARAYANVGGVEYYSAPLKYSVLTYAYNKLGKTTATPTTEAELQELLPAMLEYGALTQKYLGYKEDRLANADYTYVELSHAKLEDGFNKGLYLPEEELSVVIEEGYKPSVVATMFSDYDEATGKAILTVPQTNVTAEDLFVEEGLVETLPTGELKETQYTFANYTAGTQYAAETHTLDDNVTISIEDCHFTSELRIYSSSTNNGVAIIQSKNVIESFAFNAGNKVDTLNVYGSKDGVEWTLIEAVAITSTSYRNYEVAIGGAYWYTYLKLDVDGANQVRLKSMTLTTYERELTDAEKVEAAKNAFTLSFAEILGAATKELPTTAENDATVSWTLAENANASLTGNVLTTTNPAGNTTLTLTATFTINGETATKNFEVALNHEITDAERLAAIVDSFELNFTEISGEAEKTLPTTSGDATIAWAVVSANATITDNVLTTTNPAADTSFVLTATFTLNDETAEKTFTIALNYQDMTNPGDIVTEVAEGIEISFTELTGAVTQELPTTTENGVTVTWSVDSANATITDNVLTTTNPDADTTIVLTVTVTLSGETATKPFTVALKREAPAEPVTLATFNLGANGSASHYDGTEKSTYSETVDGYTLSITGGSKMYTGARDAKGNSCIKFGTGSAAGKMTVTVPNNVTKVILYIAKYKSNTAKIKVNDVSYTLTNASDNGAYDVIEVDTSSTKTITFTTVSGGYRSMLNTIEFIGFAS